MLTNIHQLAGNELDRIFLFSFCTLFISYKRHTRNIPDNKIQTKKSSRTQFCRSHLTRRNKNYTCAKDFKCSKVTKYYLNVR